MSKFLKFIVHFFVICTIVCVLGLALPPFFGVRTVIMDSSDKATNLPVGSVTYAIPVKTEDVAAGTPILVQEDGKSYRYNLVSVNRENNTGTVIDTTTSAQQNITVSVKNWVPKIVVTIPFVGYLLVATESIEGLIILGLVILFLIIGYQQWQITKLSRELDAVDVSSVSYRIDEVNSKFYRLDSDVDDLELRLSSVESSIDFMQSDISQLNSAIQSLSLDINYASSSYSYPSGLSPYY